MDKPAQDTTRLSSKKCVPCEGDVPRLTGPEIKAFHRRLGNGWKVRSGRYLERQFHFKDFRQAMAFTNRVGELAEAEGHHPEIVLGWGRVKVNLWTHAVNGLTENDFILAAKVAMLLEARAA